MAEWKFIEARRYECSACGDGIPDMPCDWNNGEPLYNFCPYCGANMTMKKADGLQDEPQKWEKPPKFEHKGMTTTCVNVPAQAVEDEFFREPTEKEMKAVRDYIDSISVPTGVNVFDLMDK